ncbi:MAG: addiction module protein [Phycisphaerales bacterium JB063]
MVLNTRKLIDQIESLPVEGRVAIVDALLRSLNQPDPSVDADWAKEAKRRLDDLRTGRVEGIPADEVFAKARERFGK